MHVNEITRSNFRKREVCGLRFVTAADFCSVGDVGSVECSLLFEFPIAVVNFEGVQVNAVKARQKVECEFAIDGCTALVQNFKEHFFAADPVGAFFGLEGFFLVMDDGREVAFDGGLLCLRAEKRLQIGSTFFDRGNRLLERAVICLAEICLSGREETLGVFVIGLEGKRLGESLFGIAVIAAVEQNLAVHGPNLVIVLGLGERFFADGTCFFVATEEHEGVHEGFAEILTHTKTSADSVQNINGFGILVKPHVSLGEVNAEAGTGLRVKESLHDDEGLVTLSQAPERIAQVDDVFRIVGGVAEGAFGTFAGVAVIEQCFVHFAENREQLAVLAHEIDLACKVADARAVKFFHLVHETAVDEVERFFRVHLVGAFKVAESDKRLVFEQAEDTHLAHDGGVELVLLFAGFFVACLLWHGSDFKTFDGVLHHRGVFLFVDPLRPCGDEDSATIVIEVATGVIEVEIVDDASELKFLSVAVTDLDALNFNGRIVHGKSEAAKENLEHVLLAHFFAGDDGAVHE